MQFTMSIFRFIPAKAGILAVFLFAGVASAAEWTVSESIDIMTDKVSAYATSAWTKPIKRIASPYANTEAILGIGCDDGKQQVYVKSNNLPVLNADSVGDGFRRHRINVRFDKQTPLDTSASQSSGSDTLHFHASWDDFLSYKIVKHNSMFLELNTYGRGLVYFAFNLSGAAKSISEVRAKCGFSQDNDALLRVAAIGGYTDVVNEMLAAGANPNAASEYGFMPLYWAATKGNAEIAKALLSAGANPNLKDKWGKTVLDSANSVLRGDHGRITEKEKRAIRAVISILEEAGAK